MHLDHRSLHRILALALLLALALALPPARPALAAATVMVDPTANDANDNNDGKCSLWEALQAISETAPADNKYNQCDASGGAPYTIKFKSSGKLKVLNGQLPFVTKNISLVGPVIIEGNGNDNILVVASSGILSLTNLTMTKGNPAILNNSPSGVVNIAGCSFLDNKNDGDGGAISSSGKLNIAGSVFTGNSSDGSDGGGAIWASGSEALAVAGTAFNGNIAKRSGGAIYATAPANLVDVVFNGNIANGLDPNNNGTDGDPADEYDTQGGGAVFSRNDGSNGRKMTLTRVVFNGNITGKGHGGGIYNNINSIMEIQDSAFNGNLTGKPPSDDRHGGAIVNFGGKMTVTRSTLLNNAAQGDGGGIANDRSGDLTLSNVSMTANAATGRGGAIFDFNTQQGSNIRPKLTALNVTLALNAALDEGGGIYAQDPTSSHPEVVLLANTIVANSDGPGLGGNCAGEGVTSLGHNLDSSTSCGLDGAGDLSNADPKLNTPAFHGGAISSLLSQKPDPGSAAIDAGDAQVCADAPVSSQDVRGEARPQGAVCDIGAFEAAAAVAGFGSAPVQPGPISFGNVVFGAGQNADISVFNTGTKTLELSDPQISGADAASFALITSFPMNVNAPTPLTLRCAPTGSTPGLRSATFTFKTNDPGNSTVSYNLLCNAVPQPVAGFSSTPPAPGPLDFGDVIIGQTKNGTISIKENGTATLTANSTPLGGANPGDFSIGGGFNLTLPDGAAPVAVAVSCTPTAPGIRSATLTVSTNDPTQPTVTFNLSCTGKTPPTPPLAGPGTNIVNSSTNIVAGPYGLAISPDGRHVYAADDGDDLVSAFARNPATGNLSFLDEYQDEFTGGADLDGARIVAVSGDGENVYVTGSTDGGITAFTRDLDTGGLTVLGSVKDNDGYGCFPAPCDGTVDRLAGAYGIALSPDGQHVYVSSITDSAITVLRRGLDGRLNTTTPLPFGAHFIQTITHPSLTGAYGVALSPDGAYLYATGYSSDSLLVFKRNATDGKLSYVTTYNATTIAGLNGVFRVTLSPDGNHVYTASFDGDAVTAFSRNPADGKLTHLATYADGVGGVDGLDSASSVAVSPDGTYLFATGYTDNAVAVFARDSQSGLLTFAQVIKRDGAGQPPLQGARDVAVAPDGRSVIATGRLDKRLVVLPFANPKPTLDSLGPASVTATGGALTLTVNGSGFVPGAKVRWNNAVDLPTEFVNSSQLKASVGVGLLTTPGDRPVTAVNPAPGGGASNALTFVITAQGQNPLPSIDELNPAGAAAGDPALTLTVKGANFIPGAKVLWNGVERPTTYVSGTTLQAQVLVTDVAQPGDAAVTVVNPAPGGGTSNAIGFGVAAPGQNPVPAITSLSPASIIAGANGSLTLSIAGTNFLPDSQAQWNGKDRPTTFVGAGELRMEVSGADLITPGDSSVQVINPAPGGGPSNVAGFAIGAVGENLVPALTRVTGLARNQDGTLTLTLAGSGFAGGAQAKWNGANRPTALVNSTRLTMTISVGDFAGGSAVITVTNPAPGGGLSNELLYVFTPIGMPLVRR